MLTLRTATMEDAKQLHEWRNDLLTRQNSINMDEVPWENHVAWLEKSLASPDRTLLVAEQDERPVGTVRIDREDGVLELSWTVAPDARGNGVGQKMVALCADQTEGPLVAHIKRENRASQRIAEAAGFRLEKDGELQIWRR